MSQQSSNETIEQAELGKEEVIKLLGDDEEKPEVLELPEKKAQTPAPEKEEKEEEEEEEKPDEAEEELKEIEEELEEPDEEKLELTTPVRRREILSKYPNLFKDFPYLEKAYYREQQYTEILPTIEDAKMAAEKATILDGYERDIMGGNIETVLTAVKDEDSNSFNRIVDNYLPTLAKVDQQAYFHVLGGVIKDTIITMTREGQQTGNEVLKNAAAILNQFVFGTSNFVPHQKLSREPEQKDNERENELQQREKAFVTEQFNSTLDNLQTRADNVLKATIEGHIDPKNSMSDYVRKNACRQAFENLEELMSQDTRFHNLLDRLWERSFTEKFSKNSTDAIKSAYLSKAKTLLPTVIKRARIEALKGIGKRVRETAEEEPELTTQRKSQQQPSRSGGKVKSAKEIPAGMSTLEFLSQD